MTPTWAGRIGDAPAGGRRRPRICRPALRRDRSATPRRGPVRRRQALPGRARRAARLATALVQLCAPRCRFACRSSPLVVAGCASTPPADDKVWLDEDAFRSCLGLKIPVELIRDRSRVKGSVLLEIDVLPSGRITRASILSGSGNPALDEYSRVGSEVWSARRSKPFNPTNRTRSSSSSTSTPALKRAVNARASARASADAGGRRTPSAAVHPR